MKSMWIALFFGLLLFVVGSAYSAVGGASVSSSTVGGAGQSAPTNFTISAGNIYNITASAWSSTQKWAGVYGNVTGQLLLGTSSSTLLFSWSNSAANVVVIYFSSNASADLSTLAAATSADVGSLDSGSDAWSLTFTGTGTVANSDLMPASAPMATTNPTSSGFNTYSLKDAAGNLVWAANIIPGGNTTFNGQVAQFQAILPSGTLYVWLEIK